MKKVKLFESFLSEANKGKVHKAAKQGSYPAVVVVVQDGKVIHQEPVSTPEVAPATFNVMQEKYPKALIHLEDKTGKRLFSESVATGFTEAKMTKDKLENLIYSLENENDSWHPSSDSKKKAMLDKLKKDLSKFESLVIEKREDVGKYNTVKKVINKLGRRPSEQDLATFINNNYYDVTEVERGDNDERADDKIADLVGFYKFDIDDWEIAWEDAQNESAVIESGMSDIHMFANDAKDINDFIKMFFKEFGDKVKKTADTIDLAKELYNGMIEESVVSEGKMPDKLTNDDDIVFLKTSENSKGAHYNVYYKGYDIDFGGVGFGTEKQLKSYAKEYILSRQWANKLRWEDAKPLPESVVTEARNYKESPDGKHKVKATVCYIKPMSGKRECKAIYFKSKHDALGFKDNVKGFPKGAAVEAIKESNMKYTILFEEFIKKTKSVSSQNEAVKVTPESDVKIDDYTTDNGEEIKAVEIVGAISSSETEDEFLDYFYDAYGQGAFTETDTSTLVKYFNDFLEEITAKETEEEEAEKDGGGEEEDPLADLDI